MYQNFRGRSRSFSSSRPKSNFRGRGKSSSIPSSRYVNTPVDQLVAEEAYQAQNSFADFPLDQKIKDNVITCGFTTPTPIQDQAIPALLSGKDVVGVADTGTGKTAAFLLPFIQKVLTDPEQGVLIVAPTRELAFQIRDELFAFSKNLPIGIAVCIGGANISRQVERLRKNPHFVIGTPGRLRDLVERRALDLHLFSNIILDEVDRMLDIGFRKEIKHLISMLPQERHAAFFSATMDQSTTEIMQELMSDPVTIRIKSKNSSQQIHQDVIKIKPGDNKIEVLHELLIQEEFSRVIVFGKTKHGVNRLEAHLSQKGLRVTSIHGNKNQNARQNSLDMFKRGQVQVLIATDVAARGIDVNDVTHVINFDEPQTYEDYVHRIGRTGRAGKAGKAITFIG